MDFIFLAKRYNNVCVYEIVIGRRLNTVVKISNGFDIHFIDRREEQKVYLPLQFAHIVDPLKKEVSNKFQTISNKSIQTLFVRSSYVQTVYQCYRRIKTQNV